MELSILAALRDFPRLKRWEECIAVANAAPDDLRAEVCCIGEDDSAYRLLVVAAWWNGYQGVEQVVERVGERQIALQVATLKAMQPAEALALIRLGFAGGEQQAAISEAYTLWANSRHVAPVVLPTAGAACNTKRVVSPRAFVAQSVAGDPAAGIATSPPALT